MTFRGFLIGWALMFIVFLSVLGVGYMSDNEELSGAIMLSTACLCLTLLIQFTR